jgi:hypothetical protein
VVVSVEETAALPKCPVAVAVSVVVRAMNLVHVYAHVSPVSRLASWFPPVITGPAGTQAARLVPEITSETFTPVSGTLPGLVTRYVYVTEPPPIGRLVRLAASAIAMAGRAMVTVAVAGFVVRPEAVAVATFVIEPASMSAWVIV